VQDFVGLFAARSVSSVVWVEGQHGLLGTPELRVFMPSPNSASDGFPRVERGLRKIPRSERDRIWYAQLSGLVDDRTTEPRFSKYGTQHAIALLLGSGASFLGDQNALLGGTIGPLEAVFLLRAWNGSASRNRSKPSLQL
jgi:hypothetical protein